MCVIQNCPTGSTSNHRLIRLSQGIKLFGSVSGRDPDDARVSNDVAYSGTISFSGSKGQLGLISFTRSRTSRLQTSQCIWGTMSYQFQADDEKDPDGMGGTLVHNERYYDRGLSAEFDDNYTVYYEISGLNVKPTFNVDLWVLLSLEPRWLARVRKLLHGSCPSSVKPAKVLNFKNVVHKVSICVKINDLTKIGMATTRWSEVAPVKPTMFKLLWQFKAVADVFSETRLQDTTF